MAAGRVAHATRLPARIAARARVCVQLNVSALMRFEHGATPHPWLIRLAPPGANKANPITGLLPIDGIYRCMIVP